MASDEQTTANGSSWLSVGSGIIVGCGRLHVFALPPPSTVEQPKRQETSLSFFYNLERVLLDKLYTNRKGMIRPFFL